MNSFDSIIRYAEKAPIWTVTAGPDSAAEASDWLPGLAPHPTCTSPPLPSPGRNAGGLTRAGWWVRSDGKQKSNALGQPAGYRHQLMFSLKAICSGTGPDTHRTFLLQADYLNEKGVGPVSKTKITDIAAAAGQTNLSLPDLSAEA